MTAQGNEPVLYDLAIVGGGPAGMTAAVYAARKLLRTLLVTRELGGQPLRTAGIENYMGYQYITGPELMAKFEEQARQFPLTVEEGETIARLDLADGQFRLESASGRQYRARAVVVASGKRPRTLGVPGEEELLGRGVSYCATCDGPLFRGKAVAVVGGGNSALQAALELAALSPRVYVINIAPHWQGDPLLVERLAGEEAVVPYLQHEVVRIEGERAVTGLAIRPTAGGQVSVLPVEGVFVEIGLVPNSEFLRGVVELNELGEVKIDCRNRTAVPGLFAAGDVTDVPEKQIIVAAGEGAKAALAAYQYLLARQAVPAIRSEVGAGV
ncbi:MAG: FAD-dependent oxidoreductase [Bacillota bacterium]|nr:FAD-dependent oxidoreductase [Bacillota bacterium]